MGGPLPAPSSALRPPRDLDIAIAHIERWYPQALLLAVGSSRGWAGLPWLAVPRMQVLNYLGWWGQQQGQQQPWPVAAMALSPQHLAASLRWLASRWGGGHGGLHAQPGAGSIASADPKPGAGTGWQRWMCHTCCR